MSSKRVFRIMLAVLVLTGLLSIASVIILNKLFHKEAAKLNELKLESRVIEEQQTALAQAKKDIQKYSELKDVAKLIVPQEKDQARVVREIVTFAEQSGITLASVSFPGSTLGQPKQPAATPNQEGGATPSTPAAPPITQVKPVEGISGVYQLEIVVQSLDKKPVVFNQLTTFLEKLEKNRRTAQVTNINITHPEPKNRSLLAFSLTLNIFVKP